MLMKKFRSILALLIIVSFFAVSCSGDGFLSGNILGNKGTDTGVEDLIGDIFGGGNGNNGGNGDEEGGETGGGNAGVITDPSDPSDIKNEDIKDILSDLDDILGDDPENPNPNPNPNPGTGDEGGDDDENNSNDNLPSSILTPLTPEEADKIATAAQDPKNKDLEKLKDEEVEWTESDEDGIRGAVEVVAKIFTIWDWSGSSVKTAEKYENQTSVGDVFYNLQDSLDKIYDNPETATKGDVLALKYSLTALAAMSKDISALGLTTTDDKAVTNLGTMMTAIDKKTLDFNDVVNAASEKGTLNDILGQITTYVDVVGKCSNLTGGVDLKEFISGLLSEISK